MRVVLDSVGSSGGAGNLNWFRLTPSTPSNPPPTSTPFGGTPAPVPGTFQAEDFDVGGQLAAYNDTTIGNKGGAYRSTDIDIAAAIDTGGGYYVGWTPAGEWLKYTVLVAATGIYTLEARVANIGAGATLRVEVDGVDQIGPILVPDTGGWQTWQTIRTTGMALTAGQHVMRVVLHSVGSSGGAGNLNWFRLTASTPPPP
jgi:hypothetical protein